MAAILRDSTVVVAVVRTRPRAIPLSMINHEKIHTWVSFSYMVMGLRLAALRAAGAPLLKFSLNNRPQHEAPGSKPHKLCSYSHEPRVEVYCLRLNFFNISKLVYCNYIFRKIFTFSLFQLTFNNTDTLNTHF